MYNSFLQFEISYSIVHWEFAFYKFLNIFTLSWGVNLASKHLCQFTNSTSTSYSSSAFEIISPKHRYFLEYWNWSSFEWCVLGDFGQNRNVKYFRKYRNFGWRKFLKNYRGLNLRFAGVVVKNLYLSGKHQASSRQTGPRHREMDKWIRNSNGITRPMNIHWDTFNFYNRFLS